MSPTLKRKNSPSPDTQQGEPAKRRFTEDAAAPAEPTLAATQADDDDKPTTPLPASDAPAQNDAQASRQARFAALRSRNQSSRDSNRKATATETSRVAADPGLLASLQRKKERAEEKLLEASTAETGGDYERKRAWDWTAEESAAWDRKQAKKASHRANAAFADFNQDANKTYKRQVKEMKPDTAGYEAAKMAAIERAAAGGGLEIVEGEDGELIAVDRDGSFYSTKDSVDFVGNKPGKEAIDKLVGEIRKAEEVRLKKRRDRGKGEEEGDVTYINDKNKQVSLWIFLLLAKQITTKVGNERMADSTQHTVQPETREVLQQVHGGYPREFRERHCNLKPWVLYSSPPRQ